MIRKRKLACGKVLPTFLLEGRYATLTDYFAFFRNILFVYVSDVFVSFLSLIAYLFYDKLFN